MEVSYIQGARAFDILADEWDRVAGLGMTDTPFQKLAYQRAWWTHLGPGVLHTVVAREAGEVAGIACFYLLEGVLDFNGCVEESDYLDLIAPAEQAAKVWQVTLDALTATDFPAWQTMELCNVPENSLTREILAAQASQRGWSFASEVNEVCPVITLPDSFEAYLNSLDKKQRHEVRRKLRRAGAAEVVLEQVDDEADLAEEIDDFLRLLALSTTEKGDWLNEGRRAVFHDVAAAASKAGTLQLLFLSIEGQRAAALFNFDYQRRIWVYNSGLDPALFGYLSPGVVLTAQAIQLAIESGHDSFDFLRGNETYKYRFGAQDTRIYRLSLTKQ